MTGMFVQGRGGGRQDAAGLADALVTFVRGAAADEGADTELPGR
jgi:hypothetical protein